MAGILPLLPQAMTTGPVLWQCNVTMELPIAGWTAFHYQIPVSSTVRFSASTAQTSSVAPTASPATARRWTTAAFGSAKLL